MGVEALHPDYAANVDVWTRCRDVYRGDDAVKAAGRKYLRPIDPSQNSAEYESYLQRAIFAPAFSRTVDGCVGSIARRDHVFKFPPQMAGFLADATCDGVALNEVVKQLATEILITGRAGIVVDCDTETRRSYLAIYAAEQVTNWGKDFVVLKESAVEADLADPFRSVTVEQYRHLHMVDGAYVVTIYRRRFDAGYAGTFYVHSEVVPTDRYGEPLTSLPFFFVSMMGRTPRIVQPPMLGLVNTSLNHWRISADLAHARHWTALPTLYVIGSDDDEDAPIRVGSASAIVLKNENAKVGYAEFRGDGLGSLERGLADLQAQMAALGASVFGGSQRQSETAEAARLRVGAETSILVAVVDAVQDSLQAALVCASEWMGTWPYPLISLNKSFHAGAMDAQTLGALTAALQAGAITADTFAHNLREAEMLPPE